MPYVWVDNFPAAATGREVFGFHKQVGDIRIDDPRLHEHPLSVEALALTRTGRDSRGRPMQIVSVRRVASGGPSRLRDGSLAPHHLFHLVRQITGRAHDQVTKWTWPLARSVESMLRRGQTRIVFLQQLRDVEDMTRASYQAIVEANATSLTRRGGGLLPGSYAVDITPLESHPIAADLGLRGASLMARMAFWVDLDFTMDPGQVIFARGRQTDDG
jgi:hypothetical protein